MRDRRRRNRLADLAGRGLLVLAAAVTVAILLALLLYVLVKGLPLVSWEFLTALPRRMGRLGGIWPTIVGTLYLSAVALGVAAPLGVAAAVYLAEYAPPGRLTRLCHFGSETLAGVPSIIFGLFGFATFVIFLGLGWSVLSGGLTLALMILPTVIRTAEEALKAVPRAYREGSLALGATRWQTVWHVVLPSALPGILTGLLLGLGRAVGETAAVLLTAGSSLTIPLSPLDPARTMSVHLYLLAVEGISLERAYATAAVLVITILLLNLLATRLVRRLTPKGGHA
ncbi:MAG: phosphate ABC transporter permease PstA [Bacillota bacterium]|nr:phosphate ABC transporter permease PstA [Bacillota bacterium]